MTVGEVKKILAQFSDDTDVVLMRVGPRKSRVPEEIEQVINGNNLTGYNREFAEKVVIW